MTVRLFHAITATACLLILLCQNLCPGTVCAAEISQEEIDSRLERMAGELISGKYQAEFDNHLDRDFMLYELSELSMRCGRPKQAAEFLAHIEIENTPNYGHFFSLNDFVYHAITKEHSIEKIKSYLKLKKQRIVEAREKSREPKRDEWLMDRVRCFLIDHLLVDSKWEQAASHIEQIIDSEFKIDYLLQLVELERIAGRADDSSQHLALAETLLDSLIRESWRRSVDEQRELRDVQFPIVKLWETSNASPQIILFLPKSSERMMTWLNRLKLEIDHVGGTASAQYLEQFLQIIEREESKLNKERTEGFSGYAGYFTGETFRNILSAVLEGDYSEAKALVDQSGEYTSIDSEVVEALIARNQLMKAEEFARLVRDWWGLRLVGQEHARRGNVEDVRRIIEAFRANDVFSSDEAELFPLTCRSLRKQDKRAIGAKFLHEGWDLHYVKREGWYGFDWLKSVIDTQCLFICEFDAIGEADNARQMLDSLKDFVHQMDENETYMVHHGYAHLPSYALAQLGKTASSIGQRDLALELFQEAFSFDRTNSEILIVLASAGLIDQFYADSEKNLDEEQRKELLPKALRSYYKTHAENDSQAVNFEVLRQYDDYQTRFYAELGLLEGLLSVRN